MTPDDIAMRRLMSQQISEHKFRCAKDLVDWMGAIQAQDHAMAKWAIGIRLPGSTLPQSQQYFTRKQAAIIVPAARL